VNIDVVIQSGGSDFEPVYSSSTGFVGPIEWDEMFSNADLIVSHAGMGTILKCLDVGKPLIIMPRITALGEHRNDHQLATAQQFMDFENITVVQSEDELKSALNNPPLAKHESSAGMPENLIRLTTELRQFVLEDNME